MTEYVKFISEREIEYPPHDKGSISNYDKDTNRLIADGYRELVQIERPQTDRYYEVLYKENNNKVEEWINWLETEEAYTARLFQNAKNKKVKENEDSCKAKLSSGSFTITVNNTSASYYYNTDTKNDLNSSALGFLSGILTEKQWTDEDGNTVKLSQENVAEMLLTLESWGNPIWDKWGNYKKQIEACITKEQIEAIIIDYNTIDYTKYTVAQLKALADERGISYSSNILKADLISLLENN